MSLVALIGGFDTEFLDDLQRSLSNSITGYLSAKANFGDIITRLKYTTNDGDFTSIIANYELADDSDGEDLLYFIAGRLRTDDIHRRDKVDRHSTYSRIRAQDPKAADLIDEHFEGDVEQYVEFVERYTQADLILVLEEGSISGANYRDGIKVIPSEDLVKELQELSMFYAQGDMGCGDATTPMGVEETEEQPGVPNLAKLVPDDDDDPIGPYHSDELSTE